MWSFGQRCSPVTALVSGIVFAWLICVAGLVGHALAKSISGRVERCSNDGERVNVPILGKDSCYKCFCKKGRVECDSNKCPSLEGCHAILFTRPKGHCCNVCKGCLVDGSYLASGDVWSSAENACIINICQAGVVTSSRQVCKPPCENPGHLPGQCCPSCPGCYHDGIEYLDSEVFSLKQNPSVQCVCKQGNTTCSKRLCPVLNCPEEKIYFSGGDQCPKCQGQRMVFDTPRSCFFAKRVFASGERHILDNCTSCVCVQGTMICDRQQCPELACPPKDQVITADNCCPTCKKRLSCPVANETMKPQQTWQPDKCTMCTCKDGAVRCAPKWCPHTRVCPDGYRLRYREHHCCPVCTRNDGICTLHGQRSDVIDTFDGRTYTMDGFCTHDLIRDCARSQLTVKVKYKTKGGAQKHIDIVTVRFGSTSIKLYKSSEIRINRTNLFSNHFNSNNFSLKIQPSQIIVKVKAGINVNWNLKDRLSIKVSGSYFQTGSLCGLCGNFDGDGSNDLVNKKGHIVEDARLMAFTWVRGKLCRQRLHKSDQVSSVFNKHFLVRHPYHKSRLAVKYGHPKQIDMLDPSYTGSSKKSRLFEESSPYYSLNDTSDTSVNYTSFLNDSSSLDKINLLDLSHAGPKKKSRLFEGTRPYYNLNDTSETSLNYTSFLNDSFASETSKTAVIFNYSEVNTENRGTLVAVNIEKDLVNNVTEQILVAEYNTSAEDKTTIYPAECHADSLELLEARNECHKISHKGLDSCDTGFHKANFIRSCTDVICACLQDQSCKETAVNSLLHPCKVKHDDTVIPPPP